MSMPFSFITTSMFKRIPLDLAGPDLSSQSPKSAQISSATSSFGDILVKPFRQKSSKRPLVHQNSTDSSLSIPQLPAGCGGGGDSIICDTLVGDTGEHRRRAALVNNCGGGCGGDQIVPSSTDCESSPTSSSPSPSEDSCEHNNNINNKVHKHRNNYINNSPHKTTTGPPGGKTRKSSSSPSPAQNMSPADLATSHQLQTLSPSKVSHFTNTNTSVVMSSCSKYQISDSLSSSTVKPSLENVQTRRSRCKLTFFPIRGRAEPIRLMLTFASVPFEDVRLTEREWLETKKASPSKQLPVLEFNGKSLCQPNTIARFLGSELGLCEKDNWHAAQLDSLVDAMNDVFGGLYLVLREKDEQKAIQLLKQVRQQSIKPKLQVYETFLAETGSGYFGSKSITWADFVLFCGFSGLEEWARVRLKSFPQINAFYSRMRALPAVRDWMEEHEHVPYSLVKPPGRGRRYTFSRNPYPPTLKPLPTPATATTNNSSKRDNNEDFPANKKGVHDWDRSKNQPVS